MNKRFLLSEKEFDVKGNWYAPSEFLKKYKSIVSVHLFDTTSSAGDWSGMVQQKLGDRFYVFFFNQVNIPFRSKWKLFTDRVVSVSKYPYFKDDLARIFDELMIPEGE